MLEATVLMTFSTFNADLFKSLVDKVVQIDKNTLRFIFKGGYEIEQITRLKAA